MKLYQIIMQVPDDFVPEEMQLTASFKDAIEICSEGFIGPASFTVCEEESASEEGEFDAESYYGEVSDLDSEDAGKIDPESEESTETELTNNEGEDVISNSENESKESADNNEKTE